MKLGIDNLLEDEDVVRQIRLERRTKQVAENNHVEGRRFRFRRNAGFQRVGGAIDQMGKPSLDGRIATGAQDVGGHWPMGQPGKACPVQCGKQAAGVAVTQIGLACGDIRQSRNQVLGNAARSIAATREP